MIKRDRKPKGIKIFRKSVRSKLKNYFSRVKNQVTWESIDAFNLKQSFASIFEWLCCLLLTTWFTFDLSLVRGCWGTI